MPEDSNHDYVSWGRWDATNQALTLRVNDLEQEMRGLAGAEQVHSSLADRLVALEKAGKEEHESDTTRRDRIWLLVLTMFSGIVFPILVTAVITFLHLKASH